MFEHLDDPIGYTPDEEFHSAVCRRGLRRRRRALVARTSLGMASVAILVGVAVSASIDRRLDGVDRVEVVGLASEPGDGPERPYTTLLVGVDGPAVSDPGGSDAALRSDTIVLVRVHEDDRLTVMPIPRDLWVDIPGEGPGRVNSALPRGGPSLLVATIRAELGVEVDRYVQVDFDGVREIVDSVGGLRLELPYALRDARSGLDVEAGCQTLPGEQVLALARSRHLLFFNAENEWVNGHMGDLGRIERQAAVADGLLATFSRLDPGDPIGFDRFLGAVTENVVLDSHLDRDGMVAMFRDVAGSEIVHLRLPIVDAQHGGVQVLELRPEHEVHVRAFRSGDTAEVVDPDPATDAVYTDESGEERGYPAETWLPTPC